MRFNVSSNTYVDNDLPAWGYGFLVVVFCDGLWLGLVSTRSCLGVYNEHFKNTGASPQPWTVAFCVVAYACLATSAALAFVAVDAAEAFSAGCVVGLWVFGAFNITMFAMAPPTPPRVMSNYPPATALVDTVYGALATGLLLLVQHSARTQL